MRKLFPIILITASVAVSCRTQATQEGLRIPVDGAIYIAGEMSDCAVYKVAFLAFDAHDNAGVSHTPDGLPDFCGETVALVQDCSHGDYRERYLASEGNLPERYAETLVAMSADSICCAGLADLEFSGRKPKAKIIVLASPYLAASEISEIDGIPVLKPLTLVSERIKADFPDGCSIVTIGDAATVETGLYESLLPCMSISMALEGTPAREFLSACIHRGISSPIDALVIDTPAIDAEELLSSIAEMKQEDEDYAELLRTIVPDRMEVYISRRVAADRCYELLWQENAFTHRISRPAAKEYELVCRDSGETVVVSID